jgi:Holliday junction resolvase-like predicted endonuclease/predicted transcriptional regulator
MRGLSVLVFIFRAKLLNGWWNHVFFGTFMQKTRGMDLNVECEMIISLLKLTKNGPVSHELIKKHVNLPSPLIQRLLQKLQSEGLIYAHVNSVEADDMQRVKLAILAMHSGADFERVCSFLQWKEFEAIAAATFEKNGYAVEKNLRFKRKGRRYEIDIVGCKRPLVVCMDCKHWHHGLHPSALKRIVEEQTERTVALAESLPNPSIRIVCGSWDVVRFVPAVLSLLTGESKLYNDVPVVSVLQLQDFLNHLPANAGLLRSFRNSKPSFRLEP